MCRKHYRVWTFVNFEGQQELEAGYQRKYRADAKQAVFDHYGQRCVCCSETELVFLAIDHINNDGASHRREMAVKGDRIYRWLVKNNFPSGFQVLCHNCNWGKYVLGKCPHQS